MVKNIVLKEVLIIPIWFSGALVRALDLRLEIAGSVAALLSLTFGKFVHTHVSPSPTSIVDTSVSWSGMIWHTV